LKVVLTIGTINHLTFLLFILLVSALNRFQLLDESVGLLMTVIGFIILPYVIFIEATVIILIIFLLLKGKVREVNDKLIVLFSTTLLLSSVIGTIL
jgi:hypothetical protein